MCRDLKLMTAPSKQWLQLGFVQATFPSGLLQGSYIAGLYIIVILVGPRKILLVSFGVVQESDGQTIASQTAGLFSPKAEKADAAARDSETSEHPDITHVNASKQNWLSSLRLVVGGVLAAALCKLRTAVTGRTAAGCPSRCRSFLVLRRCSPAKQPASSPRKVRSLSRRKLLEKQMRLERLLPKLPKTQSALLGRMFYLSACGLFAPATVQHRT